MAKSKKAKVSKPKGAKKDSKAGKKGGSKKKNGKKKGSKKKSKKQQLSKRDMELAKMRSEKEEQERLKREAEEKAASDKKLAIEMALRAGHLVQSASIIQTYDKWIIGKISRQKNLQEWNTFKACRNIPNFSKLYEVNSYLAYWLNQLEPPLMKKLLRLSPEFLQLVDEMHDFLEVPPDIMRLDLIRELGLLYRDMVDYQHVYLDKCTYTIMEDLSDFFDPEVGVCDYLLSIPEITHCLWGNLFTCPDINEHEFQELQFKFKIPETLLTAHGIYRLVKTEYDHFSDSCLSFFAPGVENALKQSILDWIEKHALESGDYTELQSPVEDMKASKMLKGKKDKGKKKKKKRKGSKKRHKSGKKGKRGKSGSSTVDTDDPDMDDETRKFLKEMEIENDKSKQEKKKKKAKKGKKGKKAGKGKTTDYSTGYTTTDTEEGGEDENEDEGENEGDEETKTGSKRLSNKLVSEAEFASSEKETKEERRARRHREAEEADEAEFDFSNAKLGGQDENNLYDDDDENMTAGQKKRKENDGSDSDESNLRGKTKKKDDHDKKVKKAKSKVHKEKPIEEAKKSKTKSIMISKHEVLGEVESGRKSDEPRKSLAADEDHGGKRSSSVEEPKKVVISKSKSKSKMKSKSKKKVKQTKGKRRGSSHAKKALDKARSKIKEEEDAKATKKGKRLKAKSPKKEEIVAKKSTKEKINKSKSKTIQKVKSKTESSKSRGRSKEKRTDSAGKSKGVKKAKSKSGSRGRSTTPKGKAGSKSRSKSGSKGRKSKSKSRSRSGSKKGKKKGKKKKGGKSISKERPKTEAELAKQRERAEKTKFIPQLHEHELNLRNYNILGGVYNFNLLEMPPQPRTRGPWVIHLKESDTSLKEVAFEADYLPPAPLDNESAKKTPEEMEREAKRQEEELQKLVLVDMTMPPSVQFSVDLGGGDGEEDPEDEAFRLQKIQEAAEAQLEAEKEKQFNQLITIEVTAPKIALWFEPPTPVRWDPSKRIWSTDGFFDIKFNENSLQLSFRTVRFGIMGFGHNRWSNLPYQSWELKPLGKDKVSFSLVAAMAVVEFIVMGDLICVSSLQNVTSGEEVEKAILNKYMKPKLLIKAMRYHGLDLFPEIDSYAYVDGVLVKHFEAEDHLYQCMALVSSSFNFQWSRWNLLAGRDKMVYQMRERHGTATPGNYSMVLTTPRKAIRINCTEVSPNYTEDPVVDFEYYADLLNLVRAVATDPGLRVINQTSPHHVEALRVLLSSLRPLSFS